MGLDSEIFISKGFSVLRIDISQEMIKIAKRRNPEEEFIIGNFIDINFNEKFDAVFAQAFIHLWPKQSAIIILTKIKNIIKRNGVVHITTNKSNISEEGWFEKQDYSGQNKRFRKFWTKEELDECFKEIGFEILDYYEIKDPFDKAWMVYTIKN